MAAVELALHQQVSILYTDHHGWLQGWLRRKLGDSFVAADLAHDTFMRVLTKDVPLTIEEPRALLTTVARGLMLNMRRHQRIEQAYLEALAQQPESHAPSPEAQAIMIEALMEIDRLLDGLPLKVRQAFLLSQLDGLRQSEIATRLGLSVPTVKRYIAKALEQCCFA
ncbi:sigma-70 family RNA polymerase sigma factor [Undibacterium sp. CY18W]|uniref:Sigma-70 family RNA polymerase sigma factor n=1 Tax=Undibacterium hunanense TaxID=2762292 RepID=A0ABR6ZRI5_9BURK|nr:sigma-70 family RNA polymerase sigma factor [Undibacterium hunanense]MBC3918476.1 sigma-70 family RNA polymerase sigma factor [Undibacterium hunanense]